VDVSVGVWDGSLVGSSVGETGVGVSLVSVAVAERSTDGSVGTTVSVAFCRNSAGTEIFSDSRFAAAPTSTWAGASEETTKITRMAIRKTTSNLRFVVDMLPPKLLQKFDCFYLAGL
jgi:hypothetical protein